MTERIQNILWMTEQLDFNRLSSETESQIGQEMHSFLDSTANNTLVHRFIRPSDSLPQLEKGLNELHAQQPISAVIDLTHGKISSSITLTEGLPVVTDFSISRIRQADKRDLPATGHLLSHNIEELREVFREVNTDHVLVLDDTSFSGTTSAIIEHLVRQAMPERRVQFAHGFLVLNEGELGEDLGAKQRLEGLGSIAIGGTAMHTPVDDGWHFFDIVEQENFETHIDATMEFLDHPDRQRSLDELRVLFPEMLTLDEISRAQKIGHFIAQNKISGELHTRNPQLLPIIIKQGHLTTPEKWRNGKNKTVNHLKTIHNLLRTSD